jgi:hypothetical protein
MKNEAPYLLEWIAHYRSIGAVNILIFDHESSDGGSIMLEQLAKNNIIQLKQWQVPDGTSPQIAAYSHALTELADKYEFLAFFDADEFLVPRTELSISEFLASLDCNIGAIAVNQRVFGSSGLNEFKPGLVIDRFRRSAKDDYDENHWVKTIYRTSATESIYDPHRGRLRAGLYVLPNKTIAFSESNSSGKAECIDFSLFQLNHYIIKSYEEFLLKRQRGGGAQSTQALRSKRYEDMNFFHGRDRNINVVLEETLTRRIALLQNELSMLQALVS